MLTIPSEVNAQRRSAETGPVKEPLSYVCNLRQDLNPLRSGM